jgi:GT2 family glycosyltransferase
VIVTHNGAGDVAAAVESLRRGGGVDLHVVVSDSGSSDEVESVCRDLAVPFLPGPNRGYGAGVNRALALRPFRRARYVLCMNPDVRVGRGTLADFVALCDARPAGGVFAPRQVDQHGEFVPSIGREPSPARYWRGVRAMWPEWVLDREADEHEASCDWVMGCFMLLRRGALDAIGGFDERFFLNSEEVDVCTRMRRAGFDVVHLPQLTIVHRVADRPGDARREGLIVWGQIVYMRKWFGWRERASMRAALVVRIVRVLVERLRQGEDAGREWAGLLAALRFRRQLYGPG